MTVLDRGIPLCDQVEAYLCSLNAGFCGPGIALYHESESVGPGKEAEGIDVEVAAPIGKPVPEGEQVKVRQLPRVQVAYTVHHGSFTGPGHRGPGPGGTGLGRRSPRAAGMEAAISAASIARHSPWR